MRMDQLSWWATSARANFSGQCCDRFACNFDNAPTLISRSDYIQVHGRPHRLVKTVRKDMRVTPEQARRGRSVQHVGTRMSAKAMQGSGALVGGASFSRPESLPNHDLKSAESVSR